MSALTLDQSILLWFNQEIANPVLDVLFIWLSDKVTFSFPLIGGIVIYLGVKFGKRGWLSGILLVLFVIFSDLLGSLLKDLFRQARPCLDFHALIRMPHADTTFCASSESGMPSNHALNFFATFTLLNLWFRNKVLLFVSLLLCCLVGVSRIYLGEHFPSQVISGGLIGILFGLAAAWFMNHFCKSWTPVK